MQKITTIHIHSGLHKAANELAKDNLVKGGFSGYIELLIKDNLKKHGIDWKKYIDDIPEEETTEI